MSAVIFPSDRGIRLPSDRTRHRASAGNPRLGGSLPVPFTESLMCRASTSCASG